MKDVKPQLRLASRFIKQSVKRISKTSKIEMLMKSMKIRMFRKRKKQLILYDLFQFAFGDLIGISTRLVGPLERSR